MSKKNLSAEEKMAIVMAGIKGDKTVAQICREYGISQSQYYKWRDAFLDGAKSALERKGHLSREKQLERKIEELERVIGKQAVVIEVLKKALIYPGKER